MKLSMRWLTPRFIPAGTFLLRFFPRWVALILACVVADVCFLLLATQRRALEQNLLRTAPDADARARRRLARSTFRQFAGNWVDFLRAPFVSRSALLDLVRWDTRANLDAALRLGRGVIIIGPHIGPLDLAGMYLAALGYPIAAVVEDIDPRLFRVWSRYRALTGLRVLSRRHGAVAAYRSVRRGGIVALVADRLIAGPSLEVEFCGDRRVVATGPAALALRTGAPVVMMRITRRPDGSGYDLVSEPALAASGTPEEFTRTLASRLERMVCEFPDQWFVFHAGWLNGAPPVPTTAPMAQLLDGDAR